MSAAIIPRLATALSQNGAAIPKAAVITPPSAGPTARLTLNPTLLAAIAAYRSCLGTSRGTTACHAGAVSALATPIRNVNSNKLPAVARLKNTIAAKMAETADAGDSPGEEKFSFVLDAGSQAGAA